MKTNLLILIAIVGLGGCASNQSNQYELKTVAAYERAEADRKKLVTPSVQSPPRYVQQSELKIKAKALLHQNIQDESQETYVEIKGNGIKNVAMEPVSTFSIDVDTAAYANARRFIVDGRLPPKNSVRVEEFINYFSYQYENPKDFNSPFAMHTEVGPSPWSKDRYLLHVGIKGIDIEPEDRKSKNLVFLLDVSGSMHARNKLGLVKKSLSLLTKQLTESDTVAIVVYAGSSGLVLPPTPASKRAVIMNALDQLQAGGSTNGGAGIQLAYKTAQEAFIENGVNRVILATDGDFNVGVVGVENLVNMISKKKKNGIGLTVLGFGMGNYNDHLMEMISNKGDGNAAYIDTLKEAQKVLVNDLEANMVTIAKDTKIQIEFNPAIVSEYRLVGYENRHLNREDFNNDKIDAGEVGAGHSVTAIYEIALVGSENLAFSPLRYDKNDFLEKQGTGSMNELAYLKIRYKRPNESNSNLLTHIIDRSMIKNNLENTSESFQFSAAVSAFAQKLRGGTHLNDYEYKSIMKLARQSRGSDGHGYRSEFLQLVELASSL